MNRNCNCGYCWRCRFKRETEVAFETAEKRGYARGVKRGRLLGQNEAFRKLKTSGRILDTTRVRQLLQLCHPDKHGGSQASTQATQWLLTQR
jgi:hypothetical protein